MSVAQIRTGSIQPHWSAKADRILKFTVEIYHKGLKEHKILSAPEEDILENKIGLQTKKWKEKWERLESKRRNFQEKEANINEANERTNTAIKELEDVENILVHTLSIDNKVDWEKLKRNEDFTKPEPKKNGKKRKNCLSNRTQ